MSKKILQKQPIHFIGIGGIGMSALARLYLAQGFAVSGSDLVASQITQDLQKQGAQIQTGEHLAKNIPAATQTVIYNLAISQDNPELLEAKRRGLEYCTYPQALGALTQKYLTLCIAGTHGKTTTTALVSLILINAGLDPTIIIGSKLKELDNSNARLGKSKYLVIEADEYKRAFLHYTPQIIIITNIEAEHLDYYRDFADVVSAFRAFTQRLPRGGLLVTRKEVLKLLDLKDFKDKIQIIDYLGGPGSAVRTSLKIPGDHNLENALAAYAVAQSLEIADKTILETFRNYTGAWRRFEVIYDQGVTLIDDYGHHPTEIAATLQGAREQYPGRRIWCIFQPHQWERTQRLFIKFSQAFGDADRVVITKIFGVQGRDQMNVRKLAALSKRLVKAVRENGREAVYFDHHKEILEYLGQEMRRDDVIIVMGAGNINQLTPPLIAVIKKAR